MSEILLFIPPLTQLNTPYPATAYLTGFLRNQGISTQQADLGLDLVLEIFNKNGLIQLFDKIENGNFKLSNANNLIIKNRRQYENTIEAVISFLQNKNYTLAYRISSRNYVPESTRFNHIQDLEWFFGNNGIQDKARYLCTLYLEDLGDLISATIGPQFGFSKYAERIARTAVSFGPIKTALDAPINYLDAILLNSASKYFKESIPILVGFTVPFPGNLYGALKVGQWIKQNYPQTKIVLGGGYANTELRDLSDPSVFDYVDYIVIDDGEYPILELYQHLKDPIQFPNLKRTFTKENNFVRFNNTSKSKEPRFEQLPVSIYDGLRLKEYLSVNDMPNPMHRLWSDGRWNKLTIAHGCYWKKCSFCDISLNYISQYEQSPAKILVDKMEALIAETGETGFHFVDEAAPPLAMRDLAIEILKRGLQVSWWTNIRFEKTFTADLCQLLSASGCIAITGGLEVASDRLLEKMEKGVTIEQVTQVTKAFQDAGILVHAYLMYGFPTQTEQETIDSLEIVRQLFANGLLQSAFWHQFAMTVHSPVGKNPEKFGVTRTGPEFAGFANNDLFHEDPTGADHELYSDGLKKALYNYLHGNGFDIPIPNFFDFEVPRPKVANQLISGYLKNKTEELEQLIGYDVMWNQVNIQLGKPSKNGTEVTFFKLSSKVKIEMPKVIADYLFEMKDTFEIGSNKHLSIAEILQVFSEKLNLTKNEVIKLSWWKKWRNEVIWIIKG